LVAVKTSRLLPAFRYPLVVALSFGQFALLRWLGLSLAGLGVAGLPPFDAWQSAGPW
jgi:hypothetical protein